MMEPNLYVLEFVVDLKTGVNGWNNLLMIQKKFPDRQAREEYV